MVVKFRKDLESQVKGRNLKINGYGRQSSENLFSLFEKGKDVLSQRWSKTISLLFGGYS